MKVVLIAILLVVLALGGCGVAAYNGIVSKEAGVEASWSKINSEYQRRFDLIPNLVETVKGAAEFEQSTIVEVTEARASVGKVALPKTLPSDPEQLKAYFEAQDNLSGALQRLLVVAENYPELKATENFLSLQDSIEGTESRIGAARRDYIEDVKTYNVAVRRFPGGVIAGMFGFEPKPQLEVPEGVTQRPDVKFDFKKDGNER